MADMSSQASTGKAIRSDMPIEGKKQLFIDELEVGVSGTIVVMLCRKWDVNAKTGRYLRTDFIVSDGKGNIMHCTSKAAVSHNFVGKLHTGMIYSIKDFTLIQNKQEYMVIKYAQYMIEFDGSTTARKVVIKADGFVRHPFQLVPFESIEPTNNKFLIGKDILLEALPDMPETKIEEVNVAATTSMEKRHLKKLSDDPSLSTPSKGELEDSKTEIDERKKTRRYVIEDSGSNKEEIEHIKDGAAVKKNIKKWLFIDLPEHPTEEQTEDIKGRSSRRRVKKKVTDPALAAK